MKINWQKYLLVMSGNILDYYDFLLFAHLGPLITPLFFPEFSPLQSHVISLFLFGAAFVIRPLGGFFFGKLADRKGRTLALRSSILWAVIPAFLMAILPTHSAIGLTATLCFILLRLLQGFALGGEYPVAGTYLIESSHPIHRGFMSGSLVASGTVGSLFGLFFAFLCLSPQAPSWLWRVAFLMAALGGIISFFMRHTLKDSYVVAEEKSSPLPSLSTLSPFTITHIFVITLSILIGITVWIPMAYVNFYVTKILGGTSIDGVAATLYCMIPYVAISPLFGIIAEHIGTIKWLRLAAFATLPLSLIGFLALDTGYTFTAQLLFTCSASAFGANIHTVMNTLFPKHIRCRSVSLFFMVGLSIGGLAPAISGFIYEQTGFKYAPLIFIAIASLSAGMMLLRYTFETLCETNDKKTLKKAA